MWTRFFKRSADVGGPHVNDVMEGLARLFEGLGEREVFDVVSREMRQILRCGRATVLWHDPGAASERDGDWVLRVMGGDADGALVTQADVDRAPELSPGEVASYSEDLAHRTMLKAIALAFERGEFFGCDSDDQQISLIRDPGPEDDLGSGALSLLAIPLVYHHRVGRLLERTRVGVLALYDLPVAMDLRPLEGLFGSLVGYAVTTPRCTLRDPVTSLYTADQLRTELDRYVNTFELTKQKLAGGLVVGKVDALGLLRQKLEAEGALSPTVVGQRVSEILREVGAVLQRHASRYEFGGLDYRCGVAARLGPDTFAALLPLLNEDQLALWSRRVGKSVKDLGIPGVGDEDAVVTVSLRAIPFGLPGASRVGSLWKLASECLERIGSDQARAGANRRALEQATGDLQILTKDGWRPLGHSPRPPQAGGRATP